MVTLSRIKWDQHGTCFFWDGPWVISFTQKPDGIHVEAGHFRAKKVYTIHSNEKSALAWARAWHDEIKRKG